MIQQFSDIELGLPVMKMVMSCNRLLYNDGMSYLVNQPYFHIGSLSVMTCYIKGKK